MLTIPCCVDAAAPFDIAVLVITHCANALWFCPGWVGVSAGVSKSDVMDPGSSDVAARLALGEAQARARFVRMTSSSKARLHPPRSS